MTTNNHHSELDDSERVVPGMACPRCGEDAIDSLVWIDDEQVRCDRCGTVYAPDQPDAEA
jgi:uncharacterized Zn finger protein